MPPSASVGGSYLFDRFRLSADGTLLVRDDTVVPLAPKVLQTLLVLVQRQGEVVRKEDLLRAVWPDSFVEDTGLTRNISLLRRALGDNGQRLIVNVPRVGYRFTAPVERAAIAGAHAFGSGHSTAEQSGFVVGRERELALLRGALERARGGRGVILAIAGEPGIGKTTVVETFLQEARGLCCTGRGRCSERLAGAEPHLPILEALDELTAGDSTRFDALSRLAPTWSQHVAPASGRHVVSSQPSGTGSPERLMRELATFLEDAAGAQPMVLVIEDLHWADVSTVDVLGHLAPRLSQVPLLVVVTYRQRELLITHHPFTQLRGELIARGHLDELPLSLLGLDAIRDYLGLVFGDEPMSAEIAPLVFQRTEGNPLFMVEVVRYLRQQGLPTRTPALPGEVPSSLRGLIDRMLQGLDPVTHQLLLLAAVQGYQFDSATLVRVSGTTASEVEEGLRNADQVHALVRFSHEDESADGALSLVYRFAHVLYQDALLGAIAPSRRVEWARLIGEALMVTHQGRVDSIAGSLAVLFETGREFWRASEFFLSTSRHATRLFAFATAIELAGRGLRCLTFTRAIGHVDRLRRELDLTFARLVPMASLHGYASPEVERLTQRVVELGEELGDGSATATALGATWFVRMVRGECLVANNVATRLASLALTSGNHVLLINAHMNAQIACHHLGEFGQARKYATEVMGLAGRVPYPDRCISILDPVVASLSESSRNNWITGYLASALADCEAAVTLGRELRHPDSLAFACVFHAWIHGYRGDWTTCLASAAAGMKIASESGSVQTLAWNRGVRGWALAHVGDVETGEAELSAAISMSKRIMGHIALPQFDVMMAEVLLLRDALDAAAGWLTEAGQFEQSHDDRYFAAEVHRLSAVCRAKQGAIDEACISLRKAIDVARLQGASTFALKAALNLAMLEPREGQKATRSALETIPEQEPWPEVKAARQVLQTSLP